MTCVYCATFPNGKKYIGKTGDLHQRKKAHKSDALIGKRRLVYNAIRKYGFENIGWAVLIDGLEEHEASGLEMLTIALWKTNSREVGYNLTEGGEGVSGHRHSLKTRERLSSILKGKPGNRLGAKLSEESKRKMSLAKEVKKRPLRAISINTGTVFEFPSISQCARDLDIDKHSVLLAYHKKCRQACGYYIEAV